MKEQGICSEGINSVLTVRSVHSLPKHCHEDKRIYTELLYIPERSINIVMISLDVCFLALRVFEKSSDLGANLIVTPLKNL